MGLLALPWPAMKITSPVLNTRILQQPSAKASGCCCHQMTILHTDANAISDQLHGCDTLLSLTLAGRVPRMCMGQCSRTVRAPVRRRLVGEPLKFSIPAQCNLCCFMYVCLSIHSLCRVAFFLTCCLGTRMQYHSTSVSNPKPYIKT